MKKRRGNGDVHVLRMVLTAVALIVVLVLGGRAVSGDADVTRNETTPSSVTETVTVGRGEKKFGDKCVENQECGFDGSICDKGMCQCLPELPATNHLDKCGKIVAVRNDCDFNEQCSMTTPQTECRDGKCMCQGNMHPYVKDNITQCFVRGEKKIGDRCEESLECGYDGGVCDKSKKPICQCSPELPVTNHIDKCGKEGAINESCFFNEQCEHVNYQTECRDGRCMCRYELTPVTKQDGTVDCIAPQTDHGPPQYVDPAMIGVLVGMALMFIIICVVLRLFSKARWSENRSIFNTPNPRLMNVSLLRDSKLLHGNEQRRGSRTSVRGPSRQPSMASLRPHSPTGSQGSRRGSKTSSINSGTSTRSPKSPTRLAVNNTTTTANNTVAPVLESVTVEVQDPKA